MKNLDQIIDRYLTIENVVTPGTNGPAEGGGWPTQRLILKFPDAKHESFVLGEGSSKVFAREEARLLLQTFAQEVIEAQ